MTLESCASEQALTKAAATNQLDEEMRVHLATCAACQEAVAVASWLRELADETGKDQALPSAGFIRWKSQLLERRTAARRALRPITIIQVASGFVAGFVVALLILWRPTLIEQNLALFLPRRSSFLSTSGELYILLIIFSLFIPLLCLALTYFLNRVLEDKS